MLAHLHEIQLSNFKSFCGLRVIGPLDPKYLHAIIGPNGVGKSNLIDAIAFCIGEKLSNLRAKKLQDLIHKSADSGSSNTFVAVTLKTEDGQKQVFKRSIIRNSSVYRLNEQVTTREEYHRKLRALSINVAAKNFIIHQNDINSMWMMNPRERAMLFEQMSHSIDFKEEYDRLKKHNEELSCQAKEIQSEKKKLISFYAILKSAKSAKRKELELRNNYDKTLIESILLELYFIELRTKEFKVNVSRIDGILEKLLRKIQEAEESLQDKKNQLLGLNNTATEVEAKVDDAQKVLDNIEPEYMSNQEKIGMCEKQLIRVEKSLVTAIEAHESHEHQMTTLEESLRELMEAKDRFIAQCSQQFEKPLEEMAEWDRKYDALEAMVVKQTVKLHDKMISLERVKQPLLNKIENENRKLDEIKLNIARKEMSKEDIAKRKDKMIDNIQKTEKEIKDKSYLLRELSENINSSEEIRETLEKDLKVIRDELMDHEMSEEQRNKAAEENSIVQTLRRSFPGVHDRIYNLLRPIHHRYKIAFTKVFGPCFSNIVVNTTATAMKCIKLLKRNKIGVATFLPLDDHLQVKKLKERLRSFEEQEGVPNVMLLYDLIEFPPEVQRVVLHIARNTLVCETAEIANHVAYNLPSGNKYNCVALDGSYYHNTGVFSGGTVNLEKKSRMLNAAAREDIETRKDEICEALKKIRNTENRADLEILQVEINQLREKLKYYKKYSDGMEKEFTILETEIKKMNSDLQEREEVISDTEAEINALNSKVEAVQSEINKVKDGVFADFCRDLGISSIRKYEEPLRSFKELKSKESEYDAQCERIQSLLEYERTRNTQHDVREWTVKAGKIRRQIDELCSKEKILTKEHNKAKNALNNSQNTLAVTISEIVRLREKIANEEESLRKMSISRAALNEESFAIKIMENYRQRHNLLIEAKIKDIALPLLEGGTLDRITDFYLISEEWESSQELLEMYEREDNFKFDYTYLTTKPESIANEIEFIDMKARLQQKLVDLESEISALDATTKTSQEIRRVKDDLETINRRFAETRSVWSQIQLNFKKVKQQRLEVFMGCYEVAVMNIDKIYKEMNGDESAQATLWAENEEEPYLGGIRYVCVPPKKRYCIGELSGGESALASLSLIFSIQSKNPSPFLLLDEVDAAFDTKNRKNVATYINSIKSIQQIIVISLNKQLFCTSDSFIGVYKDQRNSSQGSSSFILLDLSAYQ